MSCVPDKTIYRLLDADSGWFESASQGLVGFGSPQGLRLEDDGALDCRAHERLIPPARLTWDACRCEWLLVTPAPSRVMLLGPCDCEWQPLWSAHCAPFDGATLDAIAARGGRFAVADAAHGRVLHFARRGAQLLGTTWLAAPRLLAYDSQGNLVVGSDDGADHVRLSLIDRRLLVRRRIRVALAQGDRAIGLRVHRGAAWLLCRNQQNRHTALRVNLHSGEARVAKPRELRQALPPLPIALVSESGFCIERGPSGAAPELACFSWYGRCADHAALSRELPPCPPRFGTQGLYRTEPLDSGIDECRWHRVDFDADTPAGTELRVSCATTSLPLEPAGGLVWTAPVHARAKDFLITAPPGRYLHLKFEFSGNGHATPRLRRARIEFPRATSLEQLPPVFRQNGRVEDFTERLLALFDAMLGDTDAAIEKFPALLDARSCPDELLPWLTGWLDLAYDSRWSACVRRRVLRAIPSLYARRGTPQGMRAALEQVFGLRCGIDELGPRRAFAALDHGSRLGGVRLFGRRAARVRLDASALGTAPLKSFGNPDRDALSADAFRFRVLAPPVATASEELMRRLAELVAAQKPAHTAETLRRRRTGWIVGPASSVGVDTAFLAPPRPVLGGARGNVRLGRNSIIAAGSRPRVHSPASTRMRVGINSHLE